MSQCFIIVKDVLWHIMVLIPKEKLHRLIKGKCTPRLLYGIFCRRLLNPLDLCYCLAINFLYWFSIQNTYLNMRVKFWSPWLLPCQELFGLLCFKTEFMSIYSCYISMMKHSLDVVVFFIVFDLFWYEVNFMRNEKHHAHFHLWNKSISKLWLPIWRCLS